MSELSPDSTPSPHRTPIGSAYAKGLLGDALKASPRHKPGSGWKPPSSKDLGAMLLDFEIQSFIGRGGMGAVYKGRDVKLGRMLAIKLLPPELGSQTEFCDRFMREARSLAKLEHPNIIHVYQLGTTPEGHLYFTMEYVAGTDLKQLLKSVKKATEDTKPKVLEFDRTFKIFRQVCDALTYAHQEGIIHRDIKPANILISEKGDAKVADFGLARPLDGLDLDRLTGSREVVGTRGYMAPELLEGKEGDHRVDVYAMGVLLYELLTGELPQGSFSLPSRKRPVNKRLDQLVAKSMQPNPDARYQSIADMARELDTIQKSTLSLRTRVFAFAGFVTLALGGAYLAGKIKASSPPSPPSPPIPTFSEILYYQPFDISPGEDGLANHGKFKSTVVGKVDADSDIVPGSLTYADAAGNELVTAGNFANVDTDDETSQVSNVAPFLIPAEYNSNTLWISLIGQQTAGNASRFFSLVLRGTDNISYPADKNLIEDEIISIGVSSKKLSANWQIWDRESSSPASTMEFSKIPATQKAFLLVRIELNYDGTDRERYSLWVNPRLDQEPTQADAGFTSRHSDFSEWSEIRQIRLAAGYQLDQDPSSGWVVDEIRIGPTRKSVTPYVAPHPSR